MALKPPITLPLNTWLGALTALVVNTQIADTLTGTSTNALLDLCQIESQIESKAPSDTIHI